MSSKAASDVFNSVIATFSVLDKMLYASAADIPGLKASLSNLFPHVLDKTSYLKEQSDASENIKSSELRDLVSFLFLSVIESSKSLACQLAGRDKDGKKDLVSYHYLSAVQACTDLSKATDEKTKIAHKSHILGILSLFQLELSIREGNYCEFSLEEDEEGEESPHDEKKDDIATLRDSPRPNSESSLTGLPLISLHISNIKEMRAISQLIRAQQQQNRELAKRLADTEKALQKKGYVMDILENECDERREVLQNIRKRLHETEEILDETTKRLDAYQVTAAVFARKF